MKKPTIAQVKRALRPKLIITALTVGLVIALLDVFVEISLAVIIFSGDLSVYVSRGIGLTLFGAMTSNPGA